jgi:hypothetical protein
VVLRLKSRFVRIKRTRWFHEVVEPDSVRGSYFVSVILHRPGTDVNYAFFCGSANQWKFYPNWCCRERDEYFVYEKRVVDKYAQERYVDYSEFMHNCALMKGPTHGSYRKMSRRTKS